MNQPVRTTVTVEDGLVSRRSEHSAQEMGLPASTTAAEVIEHLYRTTNPRHDYAYDPGRHELRVVVTTEYADGSTYVSKASTPIEAFRWGERSDSMQVENEPVLDPGTRGTSQTVIGIALHSITSGWSVFSADDLDVAPHLDATGVVEVLRQRGELGKFFEVGPQMYSQGPHVVYVRMLSPVLEGFHESVVRASFDASQPDQTDSVTTTVVTDHVVVPDPPDGRERYAIESILSETLGYDDARDQTDRILDALAIARSW